MASSAPSPSPSPSPLPLFVTRSGLPRAAALLAAGRAVSVGYLGGSITQAEGYRVGTTAWLRERYPKAKITEIAAGVGGTASDLGAMRLKADVLRHRPDLLFVEFAINDGNERHDVKGAIEGIVRHTRRELPKCDIAFVYTLAQRDLARHMANVLPPASRLHEPVAEHYGLPSINVALDVARRLDRGELTWTDFSTDTCHPTPQGHALYTNTMALALTEALAAPRPRGEPKRLPRPLTTDPWEKAQMPAVSPRRHKFPGWSYRPLVNRGGWECFDGVLESDSTNPDHEAVFEFRGSAVGIYFSLGPDSGNILWAIDDAPMTKRRLVDDFAPKFTRPSYQMLAQGLKPGRHRLRIRVFPRREPGQKGRWVRIAHILCR